MEWKYRFVRQFGEDFDVDDDAHGDDDKEVEGGDEGFEDATYVHETCIGERREGEGVQEVVCR